MGSDEEFRLLCRTVGETLKPIIDSVEPLDNVRKAMARMEAGAQLGKIVLKPA